MTLGREGDGRATAPDRIGADDGSTNLRGQAGHRERAHLVATTRRLLSKATGSSVTVQEILDEARLSTRALYRHFDSKEDLIAALLRADARLAEQRLLTAMAATVTPDASVVAWLDFWLDLAFHPREVNRLRAVTVVDAQVSEPLRAVTIEVHRTSRSVLALTIESGRQQQTFSRGSAFEDARALQAIVADIVDRRVHRQPVPRRAQTRANLLGLMSRALGTELR